MRMRMLRWILVLALASPLAHAQEQGLCARAYSRFLVAENAVQSAAQTITAPVSAVARFPKLAWAYARMPRAMRNFSPEIYRTALQDFAHGTPVLVLPQTLESRLALLTLALDDKSAAARGIENILRGGDSIQRRDLALAIQELKPGKKVKSDAIDRTLFKIFALARTADDKVAAALSRDAELERMFKSYMDFAMAHENIVDSFARLGLLRDDATVSRAKLFIERAPRRVWSSIGMLWNVSVYYSGIPAYLPELKWLEAAINKSAVRKLIAENGIDAIYPQLRERYAGRATFEHAWTKFRNYAQLPLKGYLIYFVYDETQKGLREQRAEAEKQAEAAKAKFQEEIDLLPQISGPDELAQELIAEERQRYTSDDDPRFIKRKNRILEAARRAKLEVGISDEIKPAPEAAPATAP